MINQMECCELRRAGSRVSDLAKQYNVTARSIQRVLKADGLAVRSGKPDNGLDLFSVVNDEYAAYWLGFLMGDSCVSKNGNSIIVSIIDPEHLAKLKTWGNIPAPITCIKSGVINQRDMFMLGIYSKRTVANCAGFGLVYDKNKRTIPNLSSDLMRHFWRGLWDADGHITLGLACLTCKPVFIHGFRQWLAITGKGADGFLGGIYRVTDVTYRSTYSAIGAKAICKQLYTNHNISLDRKQWSADFNL